MDKEEFEKLLGLTEGETIPDDDWGTVNRILSYYPFDLSLKNMKMKAEYVANVYKLGKRHLADMESTALSTKLVTDRIVELNAEINELKDAHDKLRSGEILSVVMVEGGRLHAQWNPDSPTYREMTEKK